MEPVWPQPLLLAVLGVGPTRISKQRCTIIPYCMSCVAIVTFFTGCTGGVALPGDSGSGSCAIRLSSAWAASDVVDAGAHDLRSSLHSYNPHLRLVAVKSM